MKTIVAGDELLFVDYDLNRVDTGTAISRVQKE